MKGVVRRVDSRFAWRVSLILLMAGLALNPLMTSADDTEELLSLRFGEEGHYGIVATGVGMTESSSGSMELTVPGTAIHAAYLYWSGYATQMPGDDIVSLSVDGGSATGLFADEIFGPTTWNSGNYRFAYFVDISEFVELGSHTYTVFGFDQPPMARRDGAGIIVIYEDPGLPYSRVEIRDGLDRIYRVWGSGPRGESAVNCLTFQPVQHERQMQSWFFAGGVETARIRPNALWYKTGEPGDLMPVDIVDAPNNNPDPDAEVLQGPPNNPFTSAAGPEWDTYNNQIAIPAGASWVCTQIESAVHLEYLPSSLIGIAIGSSLEIGASLGDFVWHDLNRDGVQDDGEPGIPNVVVNLYDTNGDLVGSTTTDSSGKYLFDDLAPGDYRVEFEPPDGYGFSPSDQGGDNAADSDANPATGQTVFTTLDPGEHDPTWDAGLYRLPSIELDKTLVAYDRDGLKPNHITFTVSLLNTGVTDIDVLPLTDRYDPVYLSFDSAEPSPDEPEDDGLLTWFDLTQSFGRNLEPGQGFKVTTTFTVIREITSTINLAFAEGAEDVDGNPVDRVEDEVEIVDVPTAVDLLYFRAVREEGTTRLAWGTGVEVDSLGFRVLRGSSAEIDDAREIAFVPTSCHSSFCGAEYILGDYGAVSGTRYWYWLVEVEATGLESIHGPISCSSAVDNAATRIYLPLLARQSTY